MTKCKDNTIPWKTLSIADVTKTLIISSSIVVSINWRGELTSWHAIIMSAWERNKEFSDWKSISICHSSVHFFLPEGLKLKTSTFYQNFYISAKMNELQQNLFSLANSFDRPCLPYPETAKKAESINESNGYWERTWYIF